MKKQASAVKLSLLLPLGLAWGPGLALGALKAQPADPSDAGPEILEETGIQGGLGVHLGCGDGRLTATLCANDSYLVHGLDTDIESVRRAREARTSDNYTLPRR